MNVGIQIRCAKSLPFKFPIDEIKGGGREGKREGGRGGGDR